MNMTRLRKICKDDFGLEYSKKFKYWSTSQVGNMGRIVIQLQAELKPMLKLYVNEGATYVMNGKTIPIRNCRSQYVTPDQLASLALVYKSFGFDALAGMAAGMKQRAIAEQAVRDAEWRAKLEREGRI